MLNITIREFGKNDIGFAAEQTAREGWEATADLFGVCLEHDPEGCFIAESRGRRAAMVTTTGYRETAWIGNLIVEPDYRRQGIGERLMVHAMQHLARRGYKTIRLEADPPGINIYRRLGFAEEFESLRYGLDGGESETPTHIESLTRDNLSAVAAYDSEQFGDDRRRLLHILLDRAEAAYWVRGGGECCGYALVCPSRTGFRIGPSIASDRAAAEKLLQAALASHGGSVLTAGVPAVNDDAVSLYRAHGFRACPSSFRMVSGERTGEGNPARVYAIASGAMG
jgi:ribosomal protein S18 acetylase RimI-like enzyme